MAKTGKAKLIDLYVFEIDSKKSITNLRGFHLRAIRLVILLLILGTILTRWNKITNGRSR